MGSKPTETRQPRLIGLGEHIVICTTFAIVTCFGLFGYHIDGESGLWFCLIFGVVGFALLHAIFNAKFQAFYARFKPNRFVDVAEDAVAAVNFLSKM